MTIKELKALIDTIPDDTKVMATTLYTSENEWNLSDIIEVHYDMSRDVVVVTPEIISI